MPDGSRTKSSEEILKVLFERQFMQKKEPPTGMVMEGKVELPIDSFITYKSPDPDGIFRLTLCCKKKKIYCNS